MALFNSRVMKEALASPLPIPEQHLELLQNWAKKVRDDSIDGLTETQLEGQFASLFMERVLGYTPPMAGKTATLKPKQPMGKGEVDLALGEFPLTGPARVIAPFELKGGKTRDLDAPMPGRKISPVQQAWQYANAFPGVKWVLVSNYREIRLYAFGEGNQDFERFDLSRIDVPAEYAKLNLLLSANHFLGGHTAELLKQSKTADKNISDRLYTDYKTLRGKLIEAVNAETKSIDQVAAVGTAQKILDRVLFVAFAEDRGLLPDKSLEAAFDTQNRYDPKPVWNNFKGLFRAIDQGSDDLKITKYNGGLFQYDPLVDDLHLSDAICESFKVIGSYHFDTEVSVTVLGHIFEQSVSDVEKLLAKARGEVEDADEGKVSGVKGRRKRDGIVYTPDYIARFIVEKTLGTHVEALFGAVMAKFAKGDAIDYVKLKFKGKDELKAWENYRLHLQLLRVVDPACGSGVFLVTAFDFLKAEYDRANKKIAELRGKADYVGDFEDVDREILSQNLYGVDVNAESVEITKLSLWLKTARKGKELDSLDHNIRVGDSLIEDSNYAYLKHGFSWNAAFPEVFAEGGFDVVLGNPPYVRMELIKPMKPYLEKRFEVVSDRADLYCYFFERGLRLLKPHGRLGFISSSTFFKTGSGAPLRLYLLRHASIETVTDFGDLQIFEGVTTYPTIMTMRRDKAPADHALRFWKLNAVPDGNFGSAFTEHAVQFPQAKLGEESWELEIPAFRKLREKIVKGRRTLKEVYGQPQAGIKTGFNAAFILDNDRKQKLIKSDVSSIEIIKPYLFGAELEKWYHSPPSSWLIYIPKGHVDINKYPAIRDHLTNFKPRLEKRAADQNWFELQQAQWRFAKDFANSKIVYRDIADKPSFSIDETGAFIDMTCFVVPVSDNFLCAYLNSNVAWFVITATTTIARGGFHRMKAQYIEPLPLPSENPDLAARVSKFGLRCHETAKEFEIQGRVFRRRITDLCPPEREPKLSNKLHDWWELADFAAFRTEVKKCFKADIPVKERCDWEDLFTKSKAKIAGLSAEIRRNEDEINAIVYRLFDLTPEEIKLLEVSIAAR